MVTLPGRHIGEPLQFRSAQHFYKYHKWRVHKLSTIDLAEGYLVAILYKRNCSRARIYETTFMPPHLVFSRVNSVINIPRCLYTAIIALPLCVHMCLLCACYTHMCQAHVCRFTGYICANEHASRHCSLQILYIDIKRAYVHKAKVFISFYPHFRN